MRFCLILIAFIAIGINAEAANKGKVKKNTASKNTTTTWDQEPSSFMGIKLDTALEESILRCNSPGADKDKCYMGGDVIPGGANPVTMYAYRSPDITDIFSTPIAVISVRNGKVGTFHISFDESRFLKVHQLLSSKFGIPHSELVKEYKNLAGATLSGRKFSWSGNNVTIELEQRSSEMDKSELLIITKNFRESISTDAVRNMQNDLNKL